MRGLLVTMHLSLTIILLSPVQAMGTEVKTAPDHTGVQEARYFRSAKTSMRFQWRPNLKAINRITLVGASGSRTLITKQNYKEAAILMGENLPAQQGKHIRSQRRSVLSISNLTDPYFTGGVPERKVTITSNKGSVQVKTSVIREVSNSQKGMLVSSEGTTKEFSGSLRQLWAVKYANSFLYPAH